MWLPFIHLVQQRTKIQNAVQVQQSECGLSVPKDTSTYRKRKKMTPPFWGDVFTSPAKRLCKQTPFFFFVLVYKQIPFQVLFTILASTRQGNDGSSQPHSQRAQILQIHRGICSQRGQKHWKWERTTEAVMKSRSFWSGLTDRDMAEQERSPEYIRKAQPNNQSSRLNYCAKGSNKE